MIEINANDIADIDQRIDDCIEYIKLKLGISIPTHERYFSDEISLRDTLCFLELFKKEISDRGLYTGYTDVNSVSRHNKELN